MKLDLPISCAHAGGTSPVVLIGMVVVIGYIFWAGAYERDSWTSQPTDRDDVEAHPALKGRQIFEFERKLSVFSLRVTRASRLYRTVSKEPSGTRWVSWFSIPGGGAPVALLSERRLRPGEPTD